MNKNNESFTKVPNDFIDIFIKINISPNESKIVWVVIRKTLGWHKNEDKISFSQFQKMTNMDRRHVYKNLKRLEKRNILIIGRNKNKINSYQLNKNISNWELESSANLGTGAILSTNTVHKQALKIVPNYALTIEKKENIINKDNMLFITTEEKKDNISKEQNYYTLSAKGCAEGKNFSCENYEFKNPKLPFCNGCFYAEFWQDHKK
jgi:phage replication O-like protein O